MTLVEEKYQEFLKKPSDVNELFPTIRKYVTNTDVVLELGVREVVSTWALLANKPRFLVSVDVVQPPKEKLEEVTRAAKEVGTQFDFLQQDSTQVIIEPYVDVLFIDTLHLYSHVVKELWRHAERTRKYVMFHDYKIPEVAACVQDFLYNDAWEWAELDMRCNGLAVVKRKKL